MTETKGTYVYLAFPMMILVLLTSKSGFDLFSNRIDTFLGSQSCLLS